MAWTAPRTWIAGETVTAALLNTHVRDNFKAIGDPMTAYTPTWTASGGNPAIGNGTIAGAYMAAGKLISGRFKITMGSTTTYGTGAWEIGLPVAAIAALAETAIGTSKALDTGTAHYGRFLAVATGSSVKMNACGITADFVASAVPFAWGNTDVFAGTFTYEAA